MSGLSWKLLSLAKNNAWTNVHFSHSGNYFFLLDIKTATWVDFSPASVNLGI